MRLWLPPIVYAELPRAGLGNKLLVWARALAFARDHGARLWVSRWNQITVGPVLRRERHSRLYFGYFHDPDAAGPVRTMLLHALYKRVVEPDLVGPVAVEPGTAYVFDAQPHWRDFFVGIRKHRATVRAAILAMLARRHRVALERLARPVIGVHVRQGDFQAPTAERDFTKGGHIRAPLSYFREVIEAVRRIHGSALPCTVFSDGTSADLAELLQLRGVQRAAKAADIVDMLLLARSRVIVTSPSSTFSQWAGFLSDSVVLHQRDHFHCATRSAEVNRSRYEGPLFGPDGELMPAARDSLSAASLTS